MSTLPCRASRRSFHPAGMRVLVALVLLAILAVVWQLLHPAGRRYPAAALRAASPLLFAMPRGPLDALDPTFASFRVDIALTHSFRRGGSLLLTQGHLLETGDLLGDDELRYRFPEPQWERPEAESFLTLETSGVEEAALGFGPRLTEGRSLLVRFPRGAVRGALLHVTFGDRRAGSPGLRIPPYPLEVELVLRTDADATGTYATSPQTLTLRCIGTHAERVALIVPSTVTGSTLPVTAMVLQGLDDDRHQQVPCETFEGPLHLEGADGSRVEPSEVTLTADDRGVKRFEVELENPSCGRLCVRAPTIGLAGESNPFTVVPGQALRLLWGSVQCQSAVGGHGAGTPEQAFRVARDIAALDFFALTEHAEARAFHWTWLRELPDRYQLAERFVTFAGYEWTHPLQGHRHVILHDKTRPSYAVEGADEADEQNAPDLARFAAGPGSDPAALVIAHHTARRLTDTVERYDWGDPMPPRQLLAEVYSWHGFFDSFDAARPIDGRAGRTLPPGRGSYVNEALAQGRFIGICADSDQHLARPGLALGVWRERGGERRARHGLTGVWAPSLDRDAIFRSLEARRTYGTTGARLLVWFSCGTTPMGSTAEVRGVPTFDVWVEGTATLKEVVLLRDGLAEAALLQPSSRSLRTRLTDTGAPSQGSPLYHLHVTQTDGHEAWTSPIRVAIGK
ncbi:MAG: DUF3604 domain-containing protein [Planctomycetota bacterium]